MRNRHSRIFAALAVLAALTVSTYAPRGASAQRNTGVDTYAITNARIVTVSGPVIERGTVVIRNGLIAAVGAGVTPPPDARVIDGNGLTVYPGLIDASTTLGIPRPTPTPGAGGATGNPFAGLFGPATAPSALSPNSSQLPGLQPEILASDVIRPGGTEIEAARSAGITAAQTAPRGNVFLGQSAVINLSGDTPQQMIVRTPVALYVGLTPLAGGNYPGSLMGVFSSVRQLLLDAQRYREANAVYERSPRGLRRPEQDKSLAALQPVLARQMPVVMQAEREREIDRALDLAQEFNLQMVIVGGTEAHKVANRLRTMNVPVLLSLNFPRRTTAPSPEAEPDPVRVLRERVEAPKTAGLLASAGVRFAFQSGGMTNATDFLANAVRAVEAGLSRDEAIRAMTLRAAEILNVADRLGSIEVGKIANLTVSRGDLFGRTRQITHVFIDGRQVDLRPPTPAPAGAVSASGTWSVSIRTGDVADQPEYNVTLNLRQQGESITGDIQGELSSGQIVSGSLVGNEVRFTAPITLPGPATQTTDALFVGTLSGNQMSGTVQIVGRGPGSFTATRTGGGPAPSGAATTPSGTASPPSGAAAAVLSGTWSVNVQAGPQGIPATFVLQQQGGVLTGRVESRFGSGDVADGSASGNSFRFALQLDVEGQTMSFNFEGTVSGNQMSGTVVTPQGTYPFAGTRTP